MKINIFCKTECNATYIAAPTTDNATAIDIPVVAHICGLVLSRNLLYVIHIFSTSSKVSLLNSLVVKHGSYHLFSKWRLHFKKDTRNLRYLRVLLCIIENK